MIDEGFNDFTDLVIDAGEEVVETGKVVTDWFVDTIVSVEFWRRRRLEDTAQRSLALELVNYEGDFNTYVYDDQMRIIQKITFEDLENPQSCPLGNHKLYTYLQGADLMAMFLESLSNRNITKEELQENTF